jgi:hypothetical protein
VREGEGEKRKGKKRKGRGRDRVVQKKREKSDGDKQDKWDTCPIVNGWEEIMLSPPSQPCANTWRGESLFILKLQHFFITSRPPLY